jgi:hypothetical protein
MGLTQKLGTIPLAIFTDASNNIGIGGSPSGSYKFEVTGNLLANGTMTLGNDGTYGSTYKTLGLTGNSNGSHRILAGTADDLYIAAATSRGITFLTNGTNTARMTILSSGQIGIGTSSVDSSLSVDIQNASPTSNNVFLRLKNNSTSEDCGFKVVGNTGGTAYEHTFGVNTIINSSDFIFHNSNSLGYRWYIDSVEKLRIAPNGGLTSDCSAAGTNSQIFLNSNTTSPFGPWFRFNVDPNNSTNYYYVASAVVSGSETVRAMLLSNGGFKNYQANNVNLSDERTKKDIIPLESYWNKFKAIEIVKFKYKDQTHDDYNIGVIAQQVENVAPEFVDVDGWGETPEDGVPLKSVYTADLHHATIKVLQEAMTKIEELNAKVSALENKS